MALDGIFLKQLVDDIKPSLLYSKIDKITQPEKDELIINLRKGKDNKRLLISASSSFPRIHFTSLTKKNPMQPPMFCMVLRKHLTNGKIIDLKQINGDRLLIIKIESLNELGDNVTYSLIIEIMGRHSNISLVNDSTEKIIDCIKHISADVNSYRLLLPGVKYIYPPQVNKLNPYDFTLDDLKNIINNNQFNFDDKFSQNIFTGVSYNFSKYYYNKFKNIPINNIDQIFNESNKLFKNISDNKNFIAIKDLNDNLKDFYCINLSENSNTISYDSGSELLESYFSKKDKQDRINNKSHYLNKLINTNIERCNKKQKILNRTLEDCKSKENYRVYGDLLTSYIYTIKKGQKFAEINNFYSENNEIIKIQLDENKTPSENIQLYYKKYNKLKKSEISAIEQLEKNKEEITYLNSVSLLLQQSENYDEIEEVKKELISEGYIKFKKSNNKKKSNTVKPLHFISSDGFNIYVGKNNIQNDYLTLKFADNNNLWFHTKTIPGSHVIIKGFDPPDSTILEAASLAAYYSKGRDSSQVPVDYTLIKNVKKPNGAKAGMVIYTTNKTIYVTPNEKELPSIK